MAETGFCQQKPNRVHFQLETSMPAMPIAEITAHWSLGALISDGP